MSKKPSINTKDKEIRPDKGECFNENSEDKSVSDIIKRRNQVLKSNEIVKK